MRIGAAHIIQGNALALPLPDSSVDAVITSPPYFGLRSYQDGGSHYDGQIGSEATPAEFLDALLAATREMVRVLKPSGSIFVNLGDKYDSGTSAPRTNPGTIKDGTGQGYYLGSPRVSLGRAKSLMGIPWRYAIACIDQLGLILRAEIIWSKPNGLPESVTDRVRRSHEQWFHLVKQPRYFAAVDEIREAHEAPPSGNTRTAPNKGELRNGVHGGRAAGLTRDGWIPGQPNPLGKLPGSVWTIPTQPLTVPPELGIDHFAAYPMEWPRRIIQGWTPNGVCSVCGQGRRPVTAKETVPTQGPPVINRYEDRETEYLHNWKGVKPLTGRTEATITGYTCPCLENPLPLATRTGIPPTTPAVVLDPFGGTGTTALVAKALGRTGITVDLSSDYCRLAEWRCNDPRELAAALQVEKPEPVPVSQPDLFA